VVCPPGNIAFRRDRTAPISGGRGRCEAMVMPLLAQLMPLPLRVPSICRNSSPVALGEPRIPPRSDKPHREPSTPRRPFRSAAGQCPDRASRCAPSAVCAGLRTAANSWRPIR
jgi:hypothetical protein